MDAKWKFSAVKFVYVGQQEEKTKADWFITKHALLGVAIALSKAYNWKLIKFNLWTTCEARFTALKCFQRNTFALFERNWIELNTQSSESAVVYDDTDKLRGIIQFQWMRIVSSRIQIQFLVIRVSSERKQKINGARSSQLKCWQ